MFIPMTIVIVWRLRAEEEFLRRNLSGYSEYREKSVTAGCLLRGELPWNKGRHAGWTSLIAITKTRDWVPLN
jgi:hypothetical protein